MGVDHGGFEAGVAEQILDRADVVIGLEQVGGEGMTEGVFLRNRRTCSDPSHEFRYLKRKSRKYLSHFL